MVALTHDNLTLKPSFYKSFATHALILLALYLPTILGGGSPALQTPYEVVMTEAPAEPDQNQVSTAEDASIPDQGLPVKRSALGSLAKALSTQSIRTAKLATAQSKSSVSTARLKGAVLKSGLSSVAGTPGLAQQLGLGKLNTGFAWRTGDLQAAAGASELSPADLAMIQKILASRFSEFRDCYEKALLVDPKMSGLAQLLIPVMSGGKTSTIQVSLDGSGNSKSVSVLGGCLNGVLRKVAFPSKISGSKIQFKLRMKS